VPPPAILTLAETQAAASLADTSAADALAETETANPVTETKVSGSQALNATQPTAASGPTPGLEVASVTPSKPPNPTTPTPVTQDTSMDVSPISSLLSGTRDMDTDQSLHEAIQSLVNLYEHHGAKVDTLWGPILCGFSDLPNLQAAIMNALDDLVLSQSHPITLFTPGADSLQTKMNSAITLPDNRSRKIAMAEVIATGELITAAEQAFIDKSFVDSQKLESVYKYVIDSLNTIKSRHDAFTKAVDNMHNTIPFLVPAVSVQAQTIYKAQATALSIMIKADDDDFEATFSGPLTLLSSHLQQGSQHRLQHASFYHTLCAHIEALKAVKAKFMDEHCPKQNPIPTFSFYPEQWKIADTTSMMLARSRDKPRLPRACYYNVPTYGRARAPHASADWFCVENDTDLLDLRDNMLLDPAYKSADGATPLKLFGTKKKPVKIIIYGWKKNVLLDDDVRSYIHLLKLPISQTLVIMSTGKFPMWMYV
jgi:hypothetical protein